MKTMCLFVGGDHDGERIEVDATMEKIHLLRKGRMISLAPPNHEQVYTKYILGVHAIYFHDEGDSRGLIERVLAGYEPGY